MVPVPLFCHRLCWYQNRRIVLRGLTLCGRFWGILLHMWKISSLKSFVAPEETAPNLINCLQLLRGSFSFSQHHGLLSKVSHAVKNPCIHLQQIRHLFLQLSPLLQRCRPASSRTPPSATPSRSRTS